MRKPSKTCAFGAGLESRFRTCPETQHVPCPAPILAVVLACFAFGAVLVGAMLCNNHSLVTRFQSTVLHSTERSLMDGFLFAIQRNDTFCCLIVEPGCELSEGCF